MYYLITNSSTDLQWSSHTEFLSVTHQHIPRSADFQKMYCFLFIRCFLLKEGEAT